MKKILLCVLTIILSISMIGCSNKHENDLDTENTTSYDLYVFKFDCFEYDIDSNSFKDNILFSINLTSDYIETPKEELLSASPKYYIGEYKKFDYTETAYRTIHIYEYKDNEFSLSNNCSKVSDNWYISNSCINDDTSYIRTFYSNIDNYIIGIDIVNNDKETLSIEDSLQLLSLMINEDCSINAENEETNQNSNITVAGTLDAPAHIGEWVSTTIYNENSNKYEPICISISEIYTGEDAIKIIDDYNNEQKSLDSTYIPYEISDANSFEYVVFDYSIYYPSTFTISNKNTNINVPFSLCNLKDDNNGIDSYTKLDKTLINISTDTANITNNSIWSKGRCFFEMSTGYTNYLIKIPSKDNLSDTKYFTIN